jgi:hypothetical protein
MTKTLLSGVAALAFTFAAPSAFAQDADMQPKAKAEKMMDATDDMADQAMDEAMDKAEDMMHDAEGEMHDTMDEMNDSADMMEHSTDAKMDGDMKMDADMSMTVDCPSGTEAQADGSCMITGDWEPEG